MGAALIVGIDLITDAREGARWWHLALEGSVALAALMGVILLLRDAFTLKRSLAAETKRSATLAAEAEKWQAQAKKHVAGLSEEIDRQLNSWKLTASEKEVAFLLLKGLSLKEIADARKTTEKTARAQSTCIYEKSGLAGRSELSAFFLEDLLLP